MLVHFNIHFHTEWGQAVYVSGSSPELGEWDCEKAIKMNAIGDGKWSVELEISNKTKQIEYRYFVKDNHTKFIEEWKYNRSLSLNKNVSTYTVFDLWQDKSNENIFHSSAFTQNLFYHKQTANKKNNFTSNVVIRVYAPMVEKGKSLAIRGNLISWDNWSKPILLKPLDNCEWELSLDANEIARSFEFKFCIIHKDENIWEEGDNRTLHIPEIRDNETIIISGFHFRNKDLNWKCAGLSIPVFSLRSNSSFGIGDFLDLKKIIDWAHITGQRIVQILPINDTTILHTKEDSYPYNAISIYALHPLYLNIASLSKLKDKEKRNLYAKKQKELNALEEVDYEEVDKWKWRFFREIYKQDGAITFESKDYKNFFTKNKDWLIPYAIYSYLRDLYQTPDFRQWKQLSLYNKEEAYNLVSSHSEEIGLYLFLQFHLDKQLTEASSYAKEKGLILKGDIPIGISRLSVEAWTEPQYFNSHFQAGAPPDAFSITGQNWGFPTYNWAAMEADNYTWWKKRFNKLSDYFDAYRIDHILGFFRIWQIPAEYKDGRMGYFYPSLPYKTKEIQDAGLDLLSIDLSSETLFIEDRELKNHYHPNISASSFDEYKNLNTQQQECFDWLHWNYFYKRHNEFWKEQALKHLSPLINSTQMLVCGEDLGMIPDSVPEVMKSLDILSLEIERMPKLTGIEFTDMDSLPYLSVCTTSTHDMTTIRGWWKEEREKTQRYYNNVLRLEGEAPKDCTLELCEQIVKNHLNSNSILCIIPFQDWTSLSDLRNGNIEQERINIPANPRHYWRYRMHIPIESLLDDNELNNKIKEMITAYGRLH
ncbi:4-alpha-glucanotransferase [Bacteroidales bacterium OttesenSCG-928-I14]|nr:4-alpha-glucanotransferase [Bacteroidales bacterium OttesenSCG-928-I14]